MARTNIRHEWEPIQSYEESSTRTEARIVAAFEKKYSDLLESKDEEIQLLKDENEFLNKRIENLKDYGSLFKEYHKGVE